MINRILETDTDGILLDIKPNIENINQFIKDKVKDTFNINNCYLSMDKERFERGFIHKMKNYILIEKNENTGTIRPILHGAYFTSSKTPKVYDDAVKNLVEFTMCDDIPEDVVRDKSLNIRIRPIDDFVMRVRMSKEVSEYAVVSGKRIIDANEEHSWSPTTSESLAISLFGIVTGSQILYLAHQMQKHTGIIPHTGMSINYVMTIDPISGKNIYEYFNYADETVIHRIDFKKYEEMIERMLDAVDISPFTKTRREDNMFEDLLA